jgi:REP element-mobilizing transposase RayT
MVLLVTFSCYGSHLPGDDRGSFDHLRRGERRFMVPNAAFEDDCRRRMRQPPYVLATSAARATVRDAIASVCRHRAGFLYALHVGANHVHGVVESDSPRRVWNDCKAYATRCLRKAGLAGADQAVGTHGGSTPMIASAEGLRLAMRYVLERPAGFSPAREGGDRHSKTPSDPPAVVQRSEFGGLKMYKLQRGFSPAAQSVNLPPSVAPCKPLVSDIGSASRNAAGEV